MKALFKFLFVSLLLSGSAQLSYGQVDTSGYDNTEYTDMDTVASDVEDTTAAFLGFAKTGILEGSKPYALPDVKNTNVIFYKRLWREIDLADSANAVFKTPGSSLIEVIVDGIRSGKLKAYDATPTRKDPTGENFLTALKPSQAMSRLSGDSVTIEIVGDDGEIKGSKSVLNDFNPDNFKKFRIIEDIFYDRKRSRIETRIIGIAPLKDVNIASDITILNTGGIPPANDISASNSGFNGGIPDGNQNTPVTSPEPPATAADAPPADMGIVGTNTAVASATQALFWLNYPQARKVFATKEVVDPARDKYVLSYDDIFIRHSFKSKVVRESNPKKGDTSERLSANEADRVERELREFSHTTWKY